MRYLGGKSKTRKQISTFIESKRQGERYLEPFVGGGWVLQEISGIRTASDMNKALIVMYQELQKGWIPPDKVTEEMYQEYKAVQDSNDPCTAFIGIGCSFGGKWFGGYARQNSNYDFAIGGRNSLLRQLPKIKDVEFIHRNYVEFSPRNHIIYCDPPYANTTGYDGCPPFDTIEFWNVMREWSKKNKVIISEYSAPEDFECVLEIPTKTIIRDSQNTPIHTTEKLFMYKGVI